MQVKRSVTGRGAANKDQVGAMVQAMLKIEETPEFHDVTDALAVAICHAVNGSAPTPVITKRTNRRKDWTAFVKSQGKG